MGFTFVPDRLKEPKDEVEIKQGYRKRGVTTSIKYKAPDPKDRADDEYSYDDEQNE